MSGIVIMILSMIIFPSIGCYMEMKLKVKDPLAYFVLGLVTNIPFTIWLILFR